MTTESDRDPSYSLESQGLQESMQADNIPSIQQQQLNMCSYQSNAYQKYFSVHGNFIPVNKFPFHIYLKQRYKRLSLQEQIRIFQHYFDIQNTDKQLKLEPAHIQILNQGINLFAKVPKNSMLFLTIQTYNKTHQILTLKNYNGQIIHFKIQDKNRKRITTLIQIRRRLKDNSFLIVRDNVIYQNQKQNNWLSKKIFNKLINNFKFIYVRTIQNQSQLEEIRKQFFKNFIPNSQYMPFLENNKIYMSANFDRKQFYAYSANPNQQVSVESLRNLKQQLLSHLQTLVIQQKNIIDNDTVALKYKCRLKIFDALYINFTKATGKSKQQFIQIIKKMSIRYAHNLEEVQSDKDHFPDRILSSRRCKHCEVVGRQKNNKSKYKCLGCSKKFQVDIPLCIQCWGDFHQEVIPVCSHVSPKDMKKAYQAHQQRKSWKISKPTQNIKKINSQKYSNNQQVRNTILKLNQNMTQIQRLMDQLQSQSDIGAKIVKSFNQVLFINIIDSFNEIMLKMVHEGIQKDNKYNLSNLNLPILNVNNKKQL